MTKPPLMPKATAVWLVENTVLTFRQIAHFCNMHVLEIQGIADGEVAQSVRGIDPVGAGQLTREEIQKSEKDPEHQLELLESKIKLSSDVRRKGPRYTPLSRRQDRPNAILWLLRNHGELKDAQISRLAGTTKSTIDAIRDRSHWNFSNLAASDPVTLGLCSQIELDFEIKRAAKHLPPVEAEEAAEGESLLSAKETTLDLVPDPVASFAGLPAAEPEAKEEEAEVSIDSVFSKLQDLKQDQEG